MSLLPSLDIGLALLVVTVACSTIITRDLFAAVISYVAYGLLLAFVWIRLYAPDVALTEAAVGSGVTGVLLITAGKTAWSDQEGSARGATRARLSNCLSARSPRWSPVPWARSS